MTDNTKRPISALRDAIKSVFADVARPMPVAAAPGKELAEAQALIADQRRELAQLHQLRGDAERRATFARVRIDALRQALMDIMTGNAVAPDPVPEPILKLAHEALRADDLAAKPPAPMEAP